MLDSRESCSEYWHPHILHIRRTLDPETRRPGVVLSLATAERNIGSADGASSLERHYRDDFTDLLARALDHCLRYLLDKIYFVIEQGRLGYGSRDNGDL